MHLAKNISWRRSTLCSGILVFISLLVLVGFPFSLGPAEIDYGQRCAAASLEDSLYCRVLGAFSDWFLLLHFLAHFSLIIGLIALSNKQRFLSRLLVGVLQAYVIGGLAASVNLFSMFTLHQQPPVAFFYKPFISVPGDYIGPFHYIGPLDLKEWEGPERGMYGIALFPGIPIRSERIDRALNDFYMNAETTSP